MTWHLGECASGLRLALDKTSKSHAFFAPEGLYIKLLSRFCLDMDIG